ncbi:ATP-binding protein [Streptomyces anulatus]|uniref:ATP-binding protein n=1 Tax=Streptomyces anulatus TaxID=1892 RepID=UPI002E813173|nr:ATP-binding protein [Streptomyces anulatus]WUC90721.1 ATP-binding protein [Streptomyces anulatus]
MKNAVDMSDLTAAHRGYEYQDLMEAGRVVDLLLGGIARVHVDKKLVTDDRFDDLTVIYADGSRERTQFKHSDEEDPLRYTTFTIDDRRGLGLDRLVAAAVADRDGPGADATAHRLRIVMRDAPPDHEALNAVMVPARSSDVPFLPGMNSTLLRFDAKALWRGYDLPARGRRPAGNIFGFLTSGDRAVSKQDLEWLCEHLVVEVGAPAMTTDLLQPGPAEQLLLQRVRDELGAGIYPNEGRSPVDVAEALIRAVRSARQRGSDVTPRELLRQAQLRSDLGAVVRANPVDRATEVARPTTVGVLAEAAGTAAADGGVLLVTGPPGQGKSWACQQLVDQLTADGWLVAEHYCYLGDADGDQLTRVVTETVFGSLLGRLAEAEPDLVQEQRPRFAADAQALTTAVDTALRKDHTRRVALVVDGLDHVTRVQGGRTRRADPSLALAAVLGSLPLPPGSVLIVLSQPGNHLVPLQDAGAASIAVPPLTALECRTVAERLGLVPAADDDRTEALLSDDQDVTDFLDALQGRSGGNALYATYLCREVTLRPETITKAAVVVRALPAYHGSLEGYYAHLYDTLGAEADVVADIIALLGVSVTREELGQIVPDRAHRIDGALKVLAPVLSGTAGPNEIRVYHESFARYLRLGYNNDPKALESTLALIATWLNEKGLFDDPRAFRRLLQILAEAGRDTEVADHIGRDFVTRAIATAHPASAIRDNLATGVRCAARAANWPVVARCVELARAAQTYEFERFDSDLVEFADVPNALMGAQTLADRLLHDGRTVMPARAGLQMCAVLDAAGAVAPWHAYMTAHDHEAESDNTSYGAESDRAVELARLRGRLRLSATDQGRGEEPREDGPDWPVSLDRIAEWLEERGDQATADAVVKTLLDTVGIEAVTDLVPRLATGGPVCLALAEQIAADAVPGETGSATDWAQEAADLGYVVGTGHRLLALGIAAADLAEGIATDETSTSRDTLFSLTHDVQNEDVRWSPVTVARWLDALAITAQTDPIALDAVPALVQGPGWYPCWLRFAIALARTEVAAAHTQSGLVIEALGLLTADLSCFTGSPRACDLYSIHPLIEESVRRAAALVSDQDWPQAWKTLIHVSREVSVSLRGEMGGPLPADTLLTIAVEHTTPARRASVDEAVRNEFLQQAAGRFYSDLARYLLIHARLALTADDLAEAEKHWLAACHFLVTYGWRKDITVYELLDPLPALVTADLARGCARVARIQPLCERLVLHTDGRETNAARPRWWNVLAGADPVALAHLAATGLLSDCNSPNIILHGARKDLWRVWNDTADPVVATALRITLDTPLLEADAALLDRLARTVDPSTPDGGPQLLRIALSRADERQANRDSSSDQTRPTDAQLVAELNAVAQRVGAPQLTRLPEPSVTDESQPRRSPPIPAQSATAPPAAPSPAPSEPVDLIRVLRAWHLSPYEAGAPQHTLEQVRDLVGDGLLNLATRGQTDEAAQVLRAIAGPFDFRDGPLLLRQLADKLRQNGYDTLAAEAYALTWVRTRGQGGWLNFGGETALDALRTAAQLDRTLTHRVVTEETEAVVSAGRYGTHGITQGLIFAFAQQAFGLPPNDSLDLAFALWDEAATVIESRAPRVHDSDDPQHLYRAPDNNNGIPAPGDLDHAFATAALAAVAYADREGERRAMVATRSLVTLRPEATAPAMALALEQLTDPATLMWLLCLLQEQGPQAQPVVDHCQDALEALARGPLLTVRGLARRLLTDAASVPMGASDPAGLNPPSRLCSSAAQGDSPRDRVVTGMVAEVAGARLNNAEQLQPGLIRAVLARVRREVDTERTIERNKAQSRANLSADEGELPDAYLAIEETIEKAIQTVAAGSRAHRLSQGLGVSDPAAWEDQLATVLTDDPRIPLAFEEARWPRPDLPLPPGPDDPASEDTPLTGTTAKTISTRPLTQAVALTGQTLPGWRILASVEERKFLSPHTRKTGLTVVSFSGPEVTDYGIQDSDAIPFSDGDIEEWTRQPGQHPAVDVPPGMSLLGLDRAMTAAADADQGLGLPGFVLTPGTWLSAALRPTPGALLTLEDDCGPALRLICWRTEYERSAYRLPWPRTTGCAVVIRPDLLDILAERVPAPIVTRDVIMRLEKA